MIILLFNGKNAPIIQGGSEGWKSGHTMEAYQWCPLLSQLLLNSVWNSDCAHIVLFMFIFFSTDVSLWWGAEDAETKAPPPPHSTPFLSENPDPPPPTVIPHLTKCFTPTAIAAQLKLSSQNNKSINKNQSINKFISRPEIRVPEADALG